MTILELIAEESGIPVTEDMPIEEMGMDSLEFLDLLVSLENSGGKSIRSADIASLKTVGDLVRASGHHPS